MKYIIEINIFCLIILSSILMEHKKNGTKSVRNMYFTNCIKCAIICIIENIISQILEFGGFSFCKSWIAFNYFINIISYVAMTLCLYYWFLYSEFKIESKLVKRRRYRCILGLPVFIIFVLSIISLKTGTLFYIDKNNYYHRGDLFFIHSFFIMAYPLFSSIHSIIKARKIKDYIKRKEIILMGVAILFPIGMGLIQFFDSSLPTVNPGITFIILFVNSKTRSLRISNDYLTGINNRNSLMIYLTNKVKNISYGKKLYLCMMDVDYFKSINDGYGHLEGDKALVLVANALKETASSTNAFIARYGGDEFNLVVEADDIEYVKKVIEKLKTNLSDLTTNLPYKLTISVGIGEYLNNDSIQALFKKADEELYKLKKSRKKIER